MIRLLTLGTVDLRRDETELRSVLSQPKRLALLVYLATAAPRGFHSRDTLLALFWPEANDERARNALRQALHYLRRSLGDQVLAARGDWDVGIDGSRLTCDAASFDDAIAAGDFEQALALYRGEFMPGFYVDDAAGAEEWLDDERRRRRQAAVQAARSLSAAAGQRGDRESGLLWARRACSLDPDDPAAVEELAELESAARPQPAGSASLLPPPVVPEHPPVSTGPASSAGHVGSPRARRWLTAVPVAAALAGAAFIGYRTMRSEPTDAPTSGSAAIAVLPFVNMSGDAENEYFSDGVTEEILNALVQIDGLRVAARTSSFVYKGRSHDVRKIAQDLGVGVVLEGSVRKAGDNVRITAQLIDARNGYHLWSKTYDRELKDILAAQEDIARSISDALKLRLGRSTILALHRRQPADPQAYDLYLRGRHSISVFSEDHNNNAIGYLQQAIARDPGYALAHAALARAYIAASEFVSPRTVLPDARQAALRALELDSTLVETRLALARVRQVFDRDWRAAEQEITRAIQLDPSSAPAHLAYSELLLQSRRHAEAERERRQAWEIRRAETPDTLLPSFRVEQHLSWGSYYLHTGQSERALAEARAVIALDPENAMARWMIATALTQMGRYEEALAEMIRARARTDALSFLTALGRAYALAGQRQNAQAILDTLQARAHVRYVPKDQIALVQFSLGDTARALTTLDAAIDDYHWFVPSTNGNPVWRDLWGNPRFEALMRKLGAPR